MFNKLVCLLVAFLVIGVGHDVVFWVCMNVLGLEYETGDNIAAYYVMVVSVLLIFVLSWWWLNRRRA